MFAKLFVSVFDAEDPETIREKAVVFHDAQAAFFPNGTVMAQHLAKQWQSSDGIAPLVLFEDVTVVSLTLRATKSAGRKAFQAAFEPAEATPWAISGLAAPFSSPCYPPT